MAASLTAGKKKYAPVERDILALMEKTQALRRDMLLLADKDAAAFAPLAGAYGLPARTEEERLEKERVMEACLRGASAVPLEIMEKCGEALAALGEIAEKCSPLAVSDAGVGAAFLRAAVSGAALNVLINAKAMKNRQDAGELRRKTEALAARLVQEAERIYTAVEEKLL
jgi:formiminotetrahydrofolate cyclodeaminase